MRKFRLKTEFVESLSYLGAFKFISSRECGLTELKTKVSSKNSYFRAKNLSHRFKVVEAREGNCVVLVEGSGKRLAGHLVLEQDRFTGRIENVGQN